QPVTVKDVTILPVIKMSVGFAAGGGEGKGGSDKSSSGAGMASGGGGGASINPVGFIAIEGDKIRFIGVGKGKIETLVESVPELLKKMGFKLKKDTTSDKKEDKAKQ
ncbi:sporulation protein, partial [bacterium]|nr:sporulation protein [bacterium]